MGMISQEEYQFLKVDNPVTPILYLIPKVHKNAEVPLGRPIISAIGSLLEPTSRVLDFFLQEFVRELPAFIQDTRDFLRRIENIKWKDIFLLITLDLLLLYTSIHHEDGLRAMRHYLNKRSITLYQHSAMLVEMGILCLENNFFMYGNDTYRQVRGTAMGTCFAPSYANLHMGWWEEQVLRVQFAEEWKTNIIL